MKKSRFKLSHLNSTTLDAGYLVPFLLQPTLPNDSFRIGLSTFLRAQPMLAPLMHEVFLNTQYWFVPYRLLWDSWEEFITGGQSLDSTPNFPVVVSTADDAKVGSLWDYFGFPLETGVEVSAMPFRALAEIYNTRYRDEDLQDEIPVSYASGSDTVTSRKLLSPCISKDYFSVARPYTQRGPDIFVPVTSGESSAVIYHKHTIRVSRSIVLHARNCDDCFQKDNLQDSTYIKLYRSASAGDSMRLIQTFVYKDDPDAFMAQFNRATTWHGKTPLSFGVTNGIPPSVNLDKIVPGKKNTYEYTFESTSSVYDPGGSTHASLTIVSGEIVIFDTGGGTGREILVLGSFKSSLELEIVADETVPAPGVNGELVMGSVYQPSNSIIYRFDFNKTPPVQTLEIVHYVALTSSGAISVRDLRQSSALQRYAERSLKYGNRYEEFIQREFGISPRDSRIQRPEYLGGGRGLLNISEVLQTAESTDTGVGTMRGHGIGAITQRRIKFRSPEHGLIIGLLSVRPKLVYTQGIDREFLKRSRLDFFTPELANIGMQEVLTQEIYATNGNKGSVFGYSDRYQEYRYHKPLVTGEFRGNLNFWNMALEFANQPELNAEFVNMATYAENWKRPFQIQDGSAHAFVCMLKNHIRAYRPIPKRAKDILR